MDDTVDQVTFVNPLVDLAVRVATKAHEGQTRWEGDPYITHPLRVARTVREQGFAASFQVVAVLHDVVEDTSVTLDDISTDFGPVIRDAVDSVTYRDGETYLDFILRSRANEIGCRVKITDINDNLKDIDKFKHQKERKEKYVLARWILEN